MKRLIAIVALAGLLASCAGIKARENIQIPTMQLAYAEVVLPHVQRGLAETDAGTQTRLGPVLEAFTAAVESGIRADITARLDDWRGPLRDLFVYGLSVRVQAGEIGPKGAEILMETAVQFDANMTLLAAR